MINKDIFCRSTLDKLCHNIFCNFRVTASFIVIFILSGTLLLGEAIELCGGIRNRFVCDDQDPTVFHICLGNNQYSMICPGNLHFNLRTQNCDWPKAVNCVQEAKSRQPVDSALSELTTSSASTKTKPFVTGQNYARTRSLTTSTSTPISAASDLNKTEHSLQASEATLLETTSTEASHSRFRLKVVPSLDKPIESLLPADEKVIEEVKKLSEELKHIDNYLQSLESDQVGFMIEPYKAVFPRRRSSYANRFIKTAPRKETTPSLSPYRGRWTSPTNPLRKVMSSNPYTEKTANHDSKNLENSDMSNRAATMVSTAPRKDSTYKSTSTKIDSPYKPTTSRIDSPYKPTASRIDSPYKPTVHRIDSQYKPTSARTGSPYQPTVTLYHGSYVPTAYKRHNAPASADGNTISKTELQNHLVRSRSPYQNPYKTSEKYKAYNNNFSPSTVSQSNIFISSQTEVSPGARSSISRATHKTERPQSSTTNFVSARSSRTSWVQNSETEKSDDNKDARPHYMSRSSTSQQPSKYRSTDAHVTKSDSHGEKGLIKRPLTFKSHLPSSSTPRWSTAHSSTSSASPFAQKFSKSRATPSAKQYSHVTNKSHKPIQENISTSTTASTSEVSNQWWTPTRLEHKSTNSPDMSRRLNRKKYKPRQHFSKPNYNTRVPDMDFPLVPANARSGTFMSQTDSRNNEFINAPAAVERNFALHTSFRAPGTEERDFQLHQVNAAASIDKITLHKPYDNAISKIFSKSDEAAHIDKVFALHKSDDTSKEKVINTYKSPVEKYETKKGKCSSTWCKLPDCRCKGSDIPGDLDAKDIPQMVMLTFDDSINGQNMHYFRGLYNGTLKNPNGCTVKSTFFVSGDSSDYQMVKTVYKMGNEIASHTLSHRDPTNWWAHAGYENWEHEIVGMKNRLHEKSGVPLKEIIGMRAPFLQVGGDAQYAMLKENKFRYDTSMVTGNLYSNKQPPIWPFTLDTPPDSSTCSLTPCPSRSYPGLWEVPLIRWYGSNRVACAMPDACTLDLGAKGTLKFMEENFKRHYTTNKAPFGIFIHAAWFSRKDGHFEGLYEFLASLAEKEDVWVVTLNQALDWIQHPLRLSALRSLKSWQC